MIIHFLLITGSKIEYPIFSLTLSDNVGEHEYNDERNTAIELPRCIYSRKNWKNLRLLPDLYCFFDCTGNTAIGIIVYKTKTMRKPINFFIVYMAMSDLLSSIIWIPWGIQNLYSDSWLIGGSVGQAFCKLSFLGDLSAVVSIQSLVLIAVDRFGAVVFPLRSPLISSKVSPFFILATWIVVMAVNSPDLFASTLLNVLENWLVSGIGMKFLESPHPLRILYGCLHVYPVGVDNHTLHHHLSKGQVAEDSRRTIGQRWTTTPAEGAKCVKDGRCFRVRVCSMLAAPRVSSCLFWSLQTSAYGRIVACHTLFMLSSSCPSKLCRKSLCLFYFQQQLSTRT